MFPLPKSTVPPDTRTVVAVAPGLSRVLHYISPFWNPVPTATPTYSLTSLATCAHPIILGGRKGQEDPAEGQPPIHCRRSRRGAPHLPLSKVLVCHTLVWTLFRRSLIPLFLPPVPRLPPISKDPTPNFHPGVILDAYVRIYLSFYELENKSMEDHPLPFAAAKWSSL